MFTYRNIFLLLCISYPLLAHAAPDDSPVHSSETAKPAQATPNADHSEMDMQQGATPLSPRDPDAYADGYDFGEFGKPHMMGDENMGGVAVNRLERARSSAQTNSAYDIMAMYGQTLNRAVLKADGLIGQGRLQDARTELLWGHAIAPTWDSQFGVRHDSGLLLGRTWLAFGVQGIAPYWFNIEATAYLGERGRSALRVVSEYDLLISQKWVLQPRLEGNFYGQSDPARDLGSGLSDLGFGLRLRYEIRREFAPYAGLEWANKYAGTADFARLSGESTRLSRVVAGLRFWF